MIDKEIILETLRRIETKQDRQSERIEECLSLLAAHQVRISNLEKANEQHDVDHEKHRLEHRAFLWKVISALIAVIPSLVVGAWYLAKILP